MKLRDRVSRRVVGQPPAMILFGQWIADGGSRGEPFHMNGFPVEVDDSLVPDPKGQWTIVWADDAPPTSGRFHPNALPDEQDVEAVLQLGRALREPEAAKGGWIEWCGRSPLAPGLEDAVKPRPLEDKIEHELHHLEEVCRRARTHIRLETERVLVSRARRIDPKAPAWLAAHTEDWEHRKIAGVQPHRILAQVREEEWNLYENRVAARLVDNLIVWLRRRISEVRRVLNDIFARLAEHELSTASTRHRLKRISELWGEAWRVDQGKVVAEQTLKRLERLLFRLLRLMDSPLYRQVPRGAQVPRALRMTNLLSNDANYRGVARLWHHWSLLAAPQVLSPHQFHHRYQELRHSFDAWCMLLLVRACGQLGLDPVKDDDLQVPLAPGCSPINLPSGHCIEWDRDGTFAITDGETIYVRFVPMVHVLEAAETAPAAEARAAVLVEAAAASECWTVVLHPALPGAPPHPRLAGVGDPPLPGKSGAFDFVRVSPFSLDSVERVARVVRWATLVPRMLAYPPIVAAPPSEIAGLLATWVATRNQSRWALLRTPGPQEMARLALDRRVAEARDRRDGLEHERAEVDAELREVRGDDPRRRADLNRQKKELLKPLRDADGLVKRLETFQEDLQNGLQKLQGLATCPVCRASGELDARDNDCFAARCSRCGSTWELRLDPATRTRTPTLLPGGTRPGAWPRGKPSQWVDEFLGCDVLAIPFVEDDGSVAYLPPRERTRDGETAGGSLRARA
jgi:hypothetical protein